MFLTYWDKWHLNDLRAGCEHQRKDWDIDKDLTLIHYKWSDKYYDDWHDALAAADELL